MSALRVQLRRTKDWRLPPGTVIVDRRTKWGNFHGDTAQDFTNGILTWCESSTEASIDGVAWLYQTRVELAGKDIACWCPLTVPCHADVLLCIAASSDWELRNYTWVDQVESRWSRLPASDSSVVTR
jgi:uncharacterized protein DUF4326